MHALHVYTAHMLRKKHALTWHLTLSTLSLISHRNADATSAFLKRCHVLDDAFPEGLGSHYGGATVVLQSRCQHFSSTRGFAVYHHYQGYLRDSDG